MIPQVKKAIYDYVVDTLPEEFKGKIYWMNERKDEAIKPFCLLQAVVPEQTDRRTSEREIDGNTQELTMYKSCVVTFAIYVDGIAETSDLDDQNNYACNTARDLKNSLEWLDTAYIFGVNGISVSSISDMRDLTTTISGGYTYRYEFDVTFGYNEVLTIHKPYGKDVNLQIERKK